MDVLRDTSKMQKRRNSSTSKTQLKTARQQVGQEKPSRVLFVYLLDVPFLRSVPLHFAPDVSQTNHTVSCASLITSRWPLTVFTINHDPKGEKNGYPISKP
jgi:hypothetical protein